MTQPTARIPALLAAALAAAPAAAALAAAPAAAAPAPAPGAAAPATLGPFAVTFDAAGGYRVAHGGRVLLEAAGPATERRFKVYGAQLFGRTHFLKSEKPDFTYDRFLGARPATGGLVATYGASARPDARLTLRFRPDGGRLRVEASRQGAAGRGLRLAFVKPPAARFLGFGEQYARVDHTGHVVPLFVEEQGVGRHPREGAPADPPPPPGWAKGLWKKFVAKLPKPWEGTDYDTYYPVASFVDPGRGLGMVIEADQRVEVDCGAADPGRFTVEAWEPERLALVLAPGPTPLEVVSQITAAMGRPRTPPPWALGTWLAVEGGAARVRAAHARARAAGVALDAIWTQDWVKRRERPILQNLLYEWKLDREGYPDFEDMLAELRGDGVRFLGYVNPFLSPGTAMFKEAKRAGHLVKGHGPFSVFKAFHSTFFVAHTDFTSPAARDYFQGHIRRMVDLGMDGFMADYGEWLPWSGRIAQGDPAEEHNRYPIRYHRATRAVLDARRPDGDYAMFTRSGWTGAQRHQQIVWAGDQEATWDDRDGLKTLPRAGMSAGLSGIPFWTHDIGGYSGGPRTKELFLRWAELGAFTPVMRTHEGLMPGRNWQWDSDEETTAAFARLSRVHEAVASRVVRPLARRVAATGHPLIRHLSLHYPADPAVYAVEDQYLLGPDLLVAPVMDPGLDKRRVYLPAGTWHLAWTGEAFEGPGEVEVPAPLGEPPVFTRAPPMVALGEAWGEFYRGE